MQSGKFLLYPGVKLFISQPDPVDFGNKKNPPKGSIASWTNDNWLKSRFHFSFAEYSDAQKQQFGCLRVMNDDLVQPERGFGAHGHQNMEIVTYIIDGKLSHQDSNGNKETLGRGSIQYMTAGKGVQHSEQNLEKEPCRFIQTWIMPRSKNAPVNYASMVGNDQQAKNKWFHLVGDNQVKSDAAALINQACNFWVSQFDSQTPLDFKLNGNQQAYVLCIDGKVEISGDHGTQVMSKYDGARVFGDNALTFKSLEPMSHVLIVDMEKK